MEGNEEKIPKLDWRNIDKRSFISNLPELKTKVDFRYQAKRRERNRIRNKNARKSRRENR